MKHNCLLSIYSTLVGVSEFWRHGSCPMSLAPLLLGTAMVNWEGHRSSWKLWLTARPTHLVSYCVTNPSGPPTFCVKRLLYCLLPRVINCWELCQSMMYLLWRILTTVFPETKYLSVSLLLPLYAAVSSAY